MSILLFSFLFLGFRLLILFTSVESVFTLEELYRGTMAYDLMNHGRQFPLWDYLADEYSGGSLWIGVIAIPFYKLLGPNLIVLKLVPLLFAFGTLMASYGFLDRNFGKRAAYFGALLFIFCPPAMAGMSLIAMGFHSESILFTAAVFFCFYAWFYCEKPKPIFLYLFGFFSGLGFAFTYITLIAPAACLITWVLSRRNWNLKSVLLYAAAFMPGALPWFAFNSSHGFAGWDFLLQGFITESSMKDKLVSFAYRLAKMLLKGCPLNYGFELFLPWKFPVFSYGYYLLVLGALAFGARLKDKRWLPLGFYIAIYFPIYALSGFDIPVGILMSSRYFIPFQFMSLILIAVLSDAFVFVRKIFWILIVLGLGGQLAMLFREPVAAGLKYRGYSYGLLGKEWSFVLPGMPEGLKKSALLAQKWEQENQNDFFRGFIQHSDFNEPLDGYEGYLRSLRAAPDYRHYLAEKIGRDLAWKHPRKIRRHIGFAETLLDEDERSYFYSGLASGLYNLPRYERLWKTISPKFRRWFYFELGQFLYFTDRSSSIHLIRRMISRLNPEDLQWLYRGSGKAITAGWLYYGMSFEDSMRQSKVVIKPEFQDDVLWGVGWGLASEWQSDKSRGASWIEKIPHSNKDSAVSGFEAWRLWDRPHGGGPRIDKLEGKPND